MVHFLFIILFLFYWSIFIIIMGTQELRISVSRMTLKNTVYIILKNAYKINKKNNIYWDF